MANNPETKAAIKPTINGITEISLTDVSLVFKKLTNSRIKEPKITGMEIKNENFIAFSLLIPKILEEDIVRPEREIPGIIATAWPIPVINAIK